MLRGDVGVHAVRRPSWPMDWGCIHSAASGTDYRGCASQGVGEAVLAGAGREVTKLPSGRQVTIWQARESALRRAWMD